jgi:hypothetical protein
MKRGLVLGSLIGVAVLSMVVSGQAPPAGPTPASLAATKIEKVKDNLYVITGSGAENQAAFSGGNTAVFITDGGVTLVDTKLPGWGPRVLELVKTVTNKPVTRIINTHTHGDHTGSNAAFMGATVESVVQENTKANMAKMPEFSGANAKFLPTKDIQGQADLSGPARTRSISITSAAGTRTATASWCSGQLRTMHVGDIFAWKALPYVDTMNGGSVVEQPETLAKAVSTVKNVDTIINGHIPVGSWNDLKEYAQFTKEFVEYARASLKAGKSAAEAGKAYKVDPKYKGYVVTVNPMFAGAESNLQIAYDELKSKK